MTFMELARMSDSEQTKWMSEHTVEEYDAMLNELLEKMDHESRDFRVKSFRDRLKAYEISKAVMRGCYRGITSDGKPWRVDFSNPHNDDWHDEYYLSDYEY